MEDKLIDLSDQCALVCKYTEQAKRANMLALKPTLESLADAQNELNKMVFSLVRELVNESK